MAGPLASLRFFYLAIMEYTFRRAAESDVEAVAALVLAFGRERGAAPRDATALRNAIETCIDAPTHEIWLAETAGTVVGYAAVHWVPFPMLYGVEGYLSDLLLSQEYRGNGVGQKLLTQIELRARELGCIRLMLNNARGADSYIREFYPRQGYLERTQFANFIKRLEGQ